MYRCTNRACGKLWEQSRGCPACGATFLVPEPLDERGARGSRRRSGLRSFAELAVGAPERHRWGYGALQLPIDAVVSVEGPRGSGKSTVATVVAVALGHQAVPVLFVAAEDGLAGSLSRRIRRCAQQLGVSPSPYAQASDALVFRELEDDLLGFRRGVVVLDSIDALKIGPGQVANLRARGLGVLLVQHWTTPDLPAGGLGAAYDADVCLRVEALQVSALNIPLGTWGVWDLSPQLEAPEGVLPFPAPQGGS